jgi:hypothetical protein
MAESSSVSPTSTFVLRFWREWSATAGRWRGRIEHLQSGRRADFVDIADMLAFLQGMGVLADDRSTPPETEE